MKCKKCGNKLETFYELGFIIYKCKKCGYGQKFTQEDLKASLKNVISFF